MKNIERYRVDHSRVDDDNVLGRLGAGEQIHRLGWSALRNGGSIVTICLACTVRFPTEVLQLPFPPPSTFFLSLALLFPFKTALSVALRPSERRQRASLDRSSVILF